MEGWLFHLRNSADSYSGFKNILGFPSWSCSTNKLLQLHLHGFEFINGKYFEHVDHSFEDGTAPWSYNGKSLFVPPDLLGKPTLNFVDFRITAIQWGKD